LTVLGLQTHTTILSDRERVAGCVGTGETPSRGREQFG
jgi:hypothetical protein